MRFTFRCILALLLLAITTGLVSNRCSAQISHKTAKDDPERSQAQELYDQGKFVAAMPLFEKLVAEHPDDYVVKERWAWCLFEYSATLTDSEQIKKARIHARTLAVQANALGDDSQINELLRNLSDGSSSPSFSDRKEVDEAIKAAEADFARGDLDKARQGYLRALLLDPNNYDAALFIGDVYFKQHVYGSAGEWFSRAIQINPNRETAYRYWGDALVALDKQDAARTKFIEAIVADPYNPTAWVGMTNWLKRNKLGLNNVRLKDRVAISQTGDKNVNVTLDSSLGKDDPDGSAWFTYSLGRVSWRNERFRKEFPAEQNYRRTLREETDSLTLMITVLKEQKDYENQLKVLDPSLQSLIKIQEAGLLEPFVLINRADAEIAKDYEPYRAEHRDNLLRYFDEVVVPKIPQAPAK